MRIACAVACVLAQRTSPRGYRWAATEGKGGSEKGFGDLRGPWGNWGSGEPGGVMGFDGWSAAGVT